MEKVQNFTNEWREDPLGTKDVFKAMYQILLKMDEAAIEFNERPGISYSLRGMHKNQKDRPLFVMIDVIDDDPAERWLSVCFYGDMIQDPDELGDLIPEGLLGSDGYCFDISEADNTLSEYVQQRIHEAYANAAGK